MAEIDSSLWDGVAPAEPLPLPQAKVSAANALLENLEVPHVILPGGEIVELTDADAVIDAYDAIDKLDAQVYATKTRLKQALAEMTEGTAKTRRVAGKRRVAVVTMPDKSWDNGKLKEAYNSFPAIRDQYLRIDRVAVKAVEFNKTRNMAVVDNPPLETFLSMVASAENPPSGNPSVKVEK